MVNRLIRIVMPEAETVGTGSTGEGCISVYERLGPHLSILTDSTYTLVGIGISGAYHCEKVGEFFQQGKKTRQMVIDAPDENKIDGENEAFLDEDAIVKEEIISDENAIKNEEPTENDIK